MARLLGERASNGLLDVLLRQRSDRCGTKWLEASSASSTRAPRSSWRS